MTNGSVGPFVGSMQASFCLPASESIAANAFEAAFEPQIKSAKIIVMTARPMRFLGILSLLEYVRFRDNTL